MKLDNRVYNNCIAVLIVVLVLAILLVTVGCVTTYEIHKDPSGAVDVTVKSFREFEQPKISYSREGDTITFDFNATSASTSESPIEHAVADGIRSGALTFSKQE